VERLLAEGHTVVGLDDRERPAWAKLDSLRIEPGDPSTIGAVARALEGCDAVFHLAAKRATPDLAGFIRGNILRTAHLLQAMSVAGVRRLVHSSTVAVVGRPERFPVDEEAPPRPESVFQAIKHHTERLVGVAARAPDAVVTVLRYTTIYGPRRRTGAVHAFLRAALDGEVIRLGAGGRVRRDQVHVADVVAANIGALARREPGLSVFHVGSGEAPTERELAELAFSTLGRPAAIEMTDGPGEPPVDVVVDISRARAALGLAPRPLRDGLRALASTLTQEPRP